MQSGRIHSRLNFVWQAGRQTDRQRNGWVERSDCAHEIKQRAVCEIWSHLLAKPAKRVIIAVAQLHREPLFNPKYSGIVSFWLPCAGDGNNLTLPGIRSPFPRPNFPQFCGIARLHLELLVLVWIASEVTFGAMESLRETLANSCPDFFDGAPWSKNISKCVVRVERGPCRQTLSESENVSGLLAFS